MSYKSRRTTGGSIGRSVLTHVLSFISTAELTAVEMQQKTLCLPKKVKDKSKRGKRLNHLHLEPEWPNFLHRFCKVKKCEDQPFF